MPLFDFRCRACGREFEALVRPAHQPACPHCRSEDLERLQSTFAVSSAERTKAAAAAKRRKAAAIGRQENIVTEREIDAHRREEH